jgi:hypothetical protein
MRSQHQQPLLPQYSILSLPPQIVDLLKNELYVVYLNTPKHDSFIVLSHPTHTAFAETP